MLAQSKLLINWTKFLALALVFLFFISIYLHTDSAITQDLGRHLLLGKIIFNEKKVPDANLFSYTYPAFPFINHHWGSEVIFYLGDNFFSINGLIIFKITILLFGFFTLSIFTLKRTDIFFFILSSFLALEILRERTEVRPEIFAYLIFSLFLFILYKEKEKKSYLIWLLIPLELLWVNLHVTFVLGVILYLIFIIDRILTKEFKFTYFLLGLLIIASTLVNPQGFKGALYPLNIFNNYGYSIVENQSPFFLEKLMDNPTIFYFKLAGILFLISSPFLLIKKYFFETFAAFITLIFSFGAIRHFPFLALSLVYPLSLGAKLLYEKLNVMGVMGINGKVLKICLTIFIGVLIIWKTYLLFNNKYYLRYNQPARFGLGMVNGLKSTIDYFTSYKLSGPIFNNFDIGSYLIYRLYPQEKVFIDGRPEVYPVSFFQEVYIPAQEKEEVWQEIYKKYQFKTIVFGHTDQTPWGRKFLTRISHDRNWRIAYFDDWGVILINADQMIEGIELLDSPEKFKKYAITLIQESDQKDALLRLANFFNLVGSRDLAQIATVKADNL